MLQDHTAAPQTICVKILLDHLNASVSKIRPFLGVYQIVIFMSDKIVDAVRRRFGSQARYFYQPMFVFQTKNEYK